MVKERLWLYADKVWERLKEKPIMSLRASGPLPLEHVCPNRLILLLDIAHELQPHLPLGHWQTRMVWHRLVQRHLGQTAYNRLRGRGHLNEKKLERAEWPIKRPPGNITRTNRRKD